MSAKRKQDQHGHATTGKPTATYTVWANMVGRCCRESRRDYAYYGGRGIRICKRWREDFRNFLADMGERPEGKFLDRGNVNGNYTPTNCAWRDRTHQARNRAKHKGSSRFKGVTKAYEDRWRAEICPDGNRIYLGVFKDEKEAARAYNVAAKKHFGKSAFLNKL